MSSNFLGVCFKNLRTITLLVLVNIFPAFSQVNYYATSEQILVPKPDLKGANRVGSDVIANKDQVMIVYYSENALFFKSISNSKEISKDAVLKDNIEKYGKYFDIHHNYNNGFTYMSLIKDSDKGKLRTYYLRKVNLFDQTFEGAPIKLGDIAFANKSEPFYFKPIVSFDDEGNIYIKNISLSYKKSGEYFKFSEDIEPIEDEDEETLFLKYSNPDITNFKVKGTFYHNVFTYKILNTEKAGPKKNIPLKYTVLVCFDEDGKKVYEKDLKFYKPSDYVVETDFKFYKYNGNIYFASTYQVRQKAPIEYTTDPWYICYAKFNLERDEFEYVKSKELYTIVNESEKQYFSRTNSKNLITYLHLTPPRLTFNENGFILSVMSQTSRFVDEYIQKGDLHLKVDENGNIVKYFILKKNISALPYSYERSFPVYFSQSDGSLIGFYLANPAEPLNESFTKLKIKVEDDITKASSHFIHISPDLKVSKPVNVQKLMKSEIISPYFIPKNTMIIRSPTGDNSRIFVSYIKYKDVISFGFVTVEKD